MNAINASMYAGEALPLDNVLATWLVTNGVIYDASRRELKKEGPNRLIIRYVATSPTHGIIQANSTTSSPVPAVAGLSEFQSNVMRMFNRVTEFV